MKERKNPPTPWISSWMTSVRLEGVCHSLRSFVGTAFDRSGIVSRFCWFE
jgi:hypothetical protein